jgi:UDP-2,3-diacylglucosamine hydrolase
MELREGAILVADSHYAPWRTLFIDFLRALESGEIETSQLILMGDNCDLLFGPVDETLRLNREIIALLNTLSTSIEIVYLEGNHDFRLASLFPNITIVSRAKQPLIMEYGSQKVALLHGDITVPLGYEIYTALIRNRPLLYCLNKINNWFGGCIIKQLTSQMKRKNHCHAINDFRSMAHRHVSQQWISQCDIVIEGHYHQNKSFDFETYRYINLGAFACNERYYVVKSVQNNFVVDEAMFHKEPQ